MAYHVLKNANVLPPEAELMKDIRILEDLLKHVEDEGERKSLAKSLQWKMIRSGYSQAPLDESRQRARL